MLKLHPFIQLISITVAAGAFALGVSRFRSLHLGHSIKFRRKAHVALGRAAVFGLSLGMGVGIWAVRDAWGRSFMTLGHGKSGVAVLALFFLGAVTGVYLERVKKKRKALPLFHAVVNTIALALALHQIKTGLEVYRTFASGL